MKHLSDEKRVKIANVIGLLAMAGALFGLDVPAETQAQIVAGLAAIWQVINYGLAEYEERKYGKAGPFVGEPYRAGDDGGVPELPDDSAGVDRQGIRDSLDDL